MRKFLVLIATWLALCGGIVTAQQVLPGFPPGAFSNKAALDPAPGGGGTTTFDPANLGTGNTLSGGNLVVSTANTSTNEYAVARSVTSHSSGKYYFEVTLTSNSCGTGCIVLGIANGSALLNTGTAFPGHDANFWAACYGNEGWELNAVNNGNCVTFASTGDVIGIAVDYTAQLIWIRDVTASSTTWNAGGTANPTTGLGGQSIAAITCPCYAAYGGYADFGAESGTANFGATSYAATAPALFGNY